MRFLLRLSFLFCFFAVLLLAQSPDAPLPFQLKLIGPNIWAAIDDAKGDAGKVENWRFESNPPSWFRRVGVSRTDFARGIGQMVTVEAVRAKDGTFYGYMQKLTLADGTSWELVSGTEK